MFSLSSLLGASRTSPPVPKRSRRRPRLLVEQLEDRTVPAVVRATYLFQDTLAAEQANCPALVSVDPLTLNTFETASVFGEDRRVFLVNGNLFFPEEVNAGLVLDTHGVIPVTNYSVELVFEFTEPGFGIRKIVDVHNRGSDTGLYDFGSLGVYDADAYGPGMGDWLAVGETALPTNAFHHVVLTTGPQVVSAYLDGLREFTTPVTHAMNISPEHLISFFLDDAVTVGEYADARIALVRLYAGVLSDGEVSALANDPFGTGVTAMSGSASIGSAAGESRMLGDIFRSGYAAGDGGSFTHNSIGTVTFVSGALSRSSILTSGFGIPNADGALPDINSTLSANTDASIANRGALTLRESTALGTFAGLGDGYDLGELILYGSVIGGHVDQQV